MPIDDFLTVAQPPPIEGADLGLPDLPAPPQAPQAPQPKSGLLQMILSALPAAIGGAMGPGAGTGLMQGYAQGTQQREATERQQHQDAVREFQLQQQAYSQQQQQYESAKRQREATLQQNLQAVRAAAEKAPDKAAYDRLVEAYGNGLQMLGYRLDANWLRKAVPYAAPTADKRAWDVLQKWQSIPNNKKLLTDHPEQAANAMIPFDRDGDGEPEMVRLQDLSILAGAPLAMTADGQVFSNPGTSLETKANADGILQQLIAKTKAEGKQITPELMIALQQEAIKIADQAKPNKPAAGESETRKNMRIQSIQTSFENSPIVKDYNVIVGKAASIKQILDSGTGGPGDLALIFEFMKALDPSSVVREAEYASAAASGNIFRGWAARFNGLWNPQGGFLSPQVKQDFWNLIRGKLQVQRAQYDNYRNEKALQIERVTREPGTGTSYLVDFGAAFPELNPAASAGPKIGERRTFDGRVGEWDGKGWRPVP